MTPPHWPPCGELAHDCEHLPPHLQSIAARLAAAGNDALAESVHAAARSLASLLRAAGLALGRASRCDSCGAGRGAPPAAGCAEPCAHCRHDGTAYVAWSPPRDPSLALNAFLEEHAGLPWLGHARWDEEAGAIRVEMRRPGAAPPPVWWGYPVEADRGP